MNFLQANKIYTQVEGAPFQPGQMVRVVRRGDETMDNEYIGHEGRVQYLEYECGCGQTFSADPMIGVRFGTLPLYEFWAEEIEAV